MAETVFILGCGPMQIPALRIAREMGWNVCAADGNPDAEGRILCDKFYHIDLKDTEGLIQTAVEIRSSGRLDAVFTAGTDFSHSVSLVARAMNLPGHDPESALLATDKVLMRRRFRDAGVPSPEFVEVGEGDNPGALTQFIPGPWVVKPVDSMGARGVVKIENPEDLRPALEAARKYSRSGRALVESFMEGPEFSLDALIEDGRLIRCGIADRHIVYPPCFIEIGHTIPSALPEKTADAVWDVFEKGINALGLTRGAAKGDVKLTPDGPMIGEIAARLSGGYMSGWTWPYASGVHPTKGGLRLAAGLSAGLPEPTENLVCAERALTGIDGTIRRLDGTADALALSGVREVFLRYAPGDRITFPRNNVEKAGNVIVTAASRGDAEILARSALRRLCFELDPRDPTTGFYLDSDESFPPDAYDYTENQDLSDFLSHLWNLYPPKPSAGCPEKSPVISPPPPSSVTDYTGRTLTDSLNILAGGGLIVIGDVSGKHADPCMASDFWKALIRGGLAGARWYLEHRI